MDAVISSYEPVLRLSIYVSVFLFMALWELKAPRRQAVMSKHSRWLNNIGVVVLNTIVLRILFPSAAVGFAVLAEQRTWGLLNNMNIPIFLSIFISVIFLDLTIYFQHVLFHSVPVLWRLHRMHHADLDFDVTTGSRFHPIEIVLSMFVKITVITALGVPVLAVLIFEILLNATAMFNHANVRLSKTVDHRLRKVLVTPDMHRVHHSILKNETNSNFGFNLSCWDRLFGTYIAQPLAGHRRMEIGISAFRSPRDLRLDQMLIQPFRSPAKDKQFER